MTAMAQPNRAPPGAYTRPSNTSSSETSTIKIAGEGFRLSLLLNAAACQIAQSGIEIHSIAKGVSLFSLALKQLGLALREPNSSHSHEAVGKTREIATQGQGVFNDIGQMLDKLKGTDAHETLKTASLQQRVKWCFKRHHVTYLLAQLDSLKLSLMVMLQVLSLGRLVRSMRSSKFAADDVIAQEKAEAQNMIIVRHWAGKRLNRLWELVEQERLEAESDPTNQLIDSHYSSLNKAQTTRPTKLPVPSFGDSDRELGSMERTPRDMVQFSDRVLDQLLSAWVHEAGQSNPSSPDSKTQHRKVHFSSDSSESDNLDFESHAIHGHYLEGPTTDWRKPHSQAARYHAARQRAKYAGYQAHVESDSEGSEPRSRRESPNTDDDILFSDEDPKRRSSRSKPNPAMSTAHPTRNSPRSFDPNTSQALNQPNPQHLHPISRPQPIPSSHPRQQPYQQQQQQQQQQNHTLSHSMPVKIPPRASPSSQHPSHLQPPSHIEPYRHPSQRFSPQSPTRTQYQHSPARSYSSDTNRSHQRLPSRQKPARDSAKDRHKSLTDGATKGLIGAGAIAGFMDALEAFSAL